MTVLIIAAHPDDEILGCGGTIARMVRQSIDAYAVILGEGIASRYSSEKSSVGEKIRKLHQQSREASKIIGIKKIIHHNLPDNKFDSVPLLDIIRIIEYSIDEYDPDCIFTHNSGDLNVDHSLVFRSVLTATRPLKGSRIKDVYSFEIPSATDWSFGRIEKSFQPNVFFDITDTLPIKIRALKKYSGEMRASPHPRSYQHMMDIAHVWGAVCGSESAEAFELIRSVR